MIAVLGPDLAALGQSTKRLEGLVGQAGNGPEWAVRHSQLTGKKEVPKLISIVCLSAFAEILRLGLVSQVDRLVGHTHT